MARGVAQRFLGQPVQAGGRLLRDRLRQPPRQEPDGDPLPAGKLQAVGPQRDGQAEVVQDGGVQFISKAVRVISELGHPGFQVFQPPADRRRAGRQLLLELLDLQGQHRQLLAPVVVQLP